MKKQKKTIKEEIEELVNLNFEGVKHPWGKGIVSEQVKVLIFLIVRQTLQRFIEETKLIKMDYLKWELREDLTGRYYTIDLDKATERAKGWNAYREKLKEKQTKWLKDNL